MADKCQDTCGVSLAWKGLALVENSPKSSLTNKWFLWWLEHNQNSNHFGAFKLVESISDFRSQERTNNDTPYMIRYTCTAIQSLCTAVLCVLVQQIGDKILQNLKKLMKFGSHILHTILDSFWLGFIREFSYFQDGGHFKNGCHCDFKISWKLLLKLIDFYLYNIMSPQNTDISYTLCLLSTAHIYGA